MFWIGLALGREFLKVAIVKKEKKQISIAGIHTFSLGPDHVKQFYQLPPFQAGKKVNIVSGLSDIFIRKIHLPLKEKRKILATLPFQLETLIPFSAEQGIICPLLKPLNKQMTSVTIIAATREMLAEHLNGLKNWEIEPSHVSCTPIALMRFVHWQFPHEQQILAFHIEDQTILCVLSEGKELILSQTITANENEIDKFSIFLKQKGIAIEQIPWVLTGDKQFEHHFRGSFLGSELQSQEGSHAIAIGLALDAMTFDESTVQFCQQEFVPSATRLARKKKSWIYLSLWAAALLLMSVSGSLMLKKKQRILADRLQNYLPSTLAKEPASSLQEMQQKLIEWENGLNRQKLSFPFLLTAPKVSDTLAWLSSHPAFATEEGNAKADMEIKSVHYSLVKYPKIGETAAPYIAQMELEFTALTPRAARDFHDALLKGDLIVNSKKEVKWQTQNQTYRTAFELNRGVSP